MKRIPEETKAVMRRMRAEGASYSAIAEATGHARSRIYSLFTSDFTSTCKYVCKNCNGPTNSERKLCHQPECRKVYAREHQRENRRWYSYGLRAEDIAEMLESQNGMCALPFCFEVLTDDNMHVDHNHNTGKPRGLLCRRHNNGLGFFDDDPAMLRSAADYLEGLKTKALVLCQQPHTRTT